MEPTFFTTVHSFQGGSKHEKTHIIVYKGSLLPQRFKLSFFTNIIPKYRLCFRNTLFHKGSAVLSFHTLTQNHSISANFKLSLHQSANEFPGSVLPTIESNIFRQTKHTHTIYRYVYSMYMYISIFQVEENSSSLQCLHLPFPTQHTFYIFSCKTLVVICTWEPPFFTKAPPPKEFHSIKDKHFYKGCSPSIGCVSGTAPFFLVRKGKNKENNKTNQNMKDKEQKGKERKHI